MSAIDTCPNRWLTIQAHSVSGLFHGIWSVPLEILQHSRQLGIRRVALEYRHYHTNSHSRDDLSLCLYLGVQPEEGQGFVSIIDRVC